MLKFILDFYYFLKIKHNSLGFFGLAFNKVLTFIFFNLYYFLYPLLKKEYGVRTENHQKNIVVSLTSYPKRFKYLHLSIYSLMCQKTKADRIILWLSKEQCNYENLPVEIKKLEENGLEIFFVDDDIKSYKKIIYPILNFKDSVIITVDDDIIFDSDLFECLLNAHENYPNTVCCNMAEKMYFANNFPAKYALWKDDYPNTKEPSHGISALTGGGTLYPPNCFDSITTDLNLIKKAAPTSDDIWMKYNEARLRIPVYHIKRNFKYPLMIPGDQNQTLFEENTLNNGNDLCLEKLNKLFQINWDDLL